VALTNGDATGGGGSGAYTSANAGVDLYLGASVLCLLVAIGCVARCVRRLFRATDSRHRRGTGDDYDGDGDGDGPFGAGRLWSLLVGTCQVSYRKSDVSDSPGGSWNDDAGELPACVDEARPGPGARALAAALAAPVVGMAITPGTRRGATEPTDDQIV